MSGRGLRIVYLDHVARLSGGEIALMRLLGALEGRVDAYVILGEEGPLADRLRELSIHVEVLPLPPAVRDLRKGNVQARTFKWRTLVRILGYTLRLARRLRQIQPDLVHTNSLKSALYGGLAGRLSRTPVVWHMRDRVSPDYLPGDAVRLVRFAARILPTGVIANSQATLATLPHLRRSEVLYNPILPDAVEQSVVATRTPKSDLTVGMIGRLTPWKGQDLFLEAFADAFAGRDIRGHVIGSAMFGEDEYAARLQQQAHDLGVAEQIEFRGFREDVASELAELDILVHCSVVPEPFGQVVLEGMAAGVAVIAANAGGPAELITDGVDGLLVTPGDSAKLAEALTWLAADPAARRRLGKAARRRSQEFTPERAAAHLLEIYAALARAS